MRSSARGKIAQNGYMLDALVAPSSAINYETLGLSGLDFVVTDCEYTETSIETIAHMCRVSKLCGMAPSARAYDPDGGPMMSRILGVGVRSIMTPLIFTLAQVQNLISSTKYAPREERGVNGDRGPRWGLYGDYVHATSENYLTIAQCEFIEGLESMEEVAAMSGLDAIFIGADDLSLETDIAFKADSSASHTVDDPQTVTIVDRVLAACRGSNVIPDIVTTSAGDATRWIRQGFQLVTCMNDLESFRSRSAQHIASVRELTAR